MHHDQKNTSQTKISDPLVGQIIDDTYAVVELIHSGIYASLYKAKHKLTERFVAVKVLAENADPETEERFKREAISLSQTEHPGIVQALARGKLKSGQIYLVMEYLEGKDLSASLLEHGSLDGAAFINVFSQIIDALSHAHKLGIVHRDLKPSNIMLSQEHPSTAKIKIVDFGLASERINTKQQLTQTGKIMGTPQYMSPEQCRGEKVDLSSDIYSLSILMYESLEGTPPFSATSDYALMNMHLNEPAKPLKCLCPKELSRLIYQGLSKDPKSRPESVALFGDCLSQIESKKWSKPKEGKKKTNASKSAWNQVLALTIAVVLLTVLSLSYCLRTASGMKLLIDLTCSKGNEEAQLKSLSNLTQYTNSWLDKKAKQTLALKKLVISGSLYGPNSDQYLSAASNYLESNPDPILTDRIANKFIQLALDPNNQSSEYCNQAIHFITIDTSISNHKKFDLFREIARKYMEQNLYKESIKLNEEILPPPLKAENREFKESQLRAFQKKWGYNSDELAQARAEILETLGNCYAKMQNYNKSIEMYRLAESTWPSTKQEFMLADQRNIAACLKDNGQVEKSIKLLKELIEKYKKQYPNGNGRYYTTFELADTLDHRQNWKESILLYEESIKGFRAICEQNDPRNKPITPELMTRRYLRYLDCFSQKASSQEFQNKLADFRSLCSKTLGNDSYLNAKAYAFDANNDMNNKQYESALKKYATALALISKNDDDKKSKAEIEDSIAQAYRQLGKPADAALHYDKALSYKVMKNRARLLIELSQVQIRENLLNDADKNLEEACKIVSKGKYNKHQKQNYLDWASIEMKLGRIGKSTVIKNWVNSAGTTISPF